MSEKEKMDLQPAGERKPEKAAPKKPGVFERMGKGIAKWTREIRSELKKVIWPTGPQTVRNTLIVLACVLFVGVFIWIFDGLAGLGVKALIDTVKG